MSAFARPIRSNWLQFQPKVIGLVMLAGVWLHSPLLFAALSAVLWWSALFPARNPFDAAYNRLVAARSGRQPLTPAPNPRRFAQGLAATLLMIIVFSLLTGRLILAAAVELFLLAAIAAILFGGFCFGSFVFHLLSGNGAFARRTLPWS